VRASVAAGEALLFEGDYFGPLVNLAARLVAEAAPRQVVVPADAVDELSGKWVVTSMGTRDLKGFAEPVGLAAIKRR
jgi:class 3 adenylate cyclase